jgi:hypothetical protein
MSARIALVFNSFLGRKYRVQLSLRHSTLTTARHEHTASGIELKIQSPLNPTPHVLPRSTLPPPVGVAACMDNKLRTDTCGDPTGRARVDR